MNKEQVKQLIKGSFEGKSFEEEITETHISWVVFTEDYAFKIKKPVKFSFLDFSSIQKRKHFCEEEIRLNSRLSDIYLGVLSINQTDSGFSLENRSGEVADYAVQMKKLDPDYKMDKRLKRNEVNEKHLQQLASLISLFHQRAEVVKPVLDFRKMKEDFNDIEKCREWTKKNLSSELADIITKSVEYSNSFLSRHKKLFRQRVKDGFYREVHGDLHSRNIFLLKEPVIFDCIEFNEEFRKIDLLDELAFFCMDMEASGHAELSDLFMKHYQTYFEVMRNSSEKELLNYFKCYRANVRAKVSILKSQQEEKDLDLQLIKNYLQLMQKYITTVE